MKNIRFNRKSRKTAANANASYKAGYKAGWEACHDAFTASMRKTMVSTNQRVEENSILYDRLVEHRQNAKGG